MLNINDRKALRRNRAAVSWLCIFIGILLVCTFSLYQSSKELKSKVSNHIIDIKDYQNQISQKNKTIDSLYQELKNNQLSKDTSKPVVKQIIKPKDVKKDTNEFKLKSDTSNKILKDSLK